MAIRRNRNIRRIVVNQEEIKLSQYTDDTTLILDGSRESLFTALSVFHDFGEVSGLNLDSQKSEALLIGSNTRENKTLQNRLRFEVAALKSQFSDPK